MALAFVWFWFPIAIGMADLRYATNHVYQIIYTSALVLENLATRAILSFPEDSFLVPYDQVSSDIREQWESGIRLDLSGEVMILTTEVLIRLCLNLLYDRLL